MNKVRFFCNVCGSTRVLRDAYASWDVKAQAWVCSSVYDAVFCEECDGETTLKEVPLGQPEIEQVLVLSTAHVPPDLPDMPDDESFTLTVADIDDAQIREELHFALLDIFRLATDLGCWRVRLDRDGPVNPGLPTYEWE